MKLMRTLLSIVLLFVVVAGIAIGALMYFINPNKLKPLIAEEVRKKTGYEVTIDGNFTWSLLPRLGVKVGRIRFTAPQQKTPFLDLQGVVFVTEIGQLLRGNQKWRGDIYIDDVALDNVHAKNAHVGLNFQDNILNLKPMTASFYQGSLNGIALGRDLDGIPAWAFDVNVTGADLHQLLADVNGADSLLQLNGNGDVKVRATLRGKTREQVLNNFNGTASFAVKNGTLQGADLNYLVKSADALISKQQVSLPAEKYDQTTFDKLQGSAQIKNGIASTNDLLLQSSGLVAQGSGTVNLIFQSLNIQLHLAPIGDKPKWLIPVLVTGTLNRPDVRLDMTELNMMQAKRKIDEVKTKVRDELKKHVSGKAGDVLQNLLSR